MSFDCNRTFFQYLVLFHPRNSRSWPRTSASCKPWEGQHCKSMGIKGGRVLRWRAKVGMFLLTVYLKIHVLVWPGKGAPRKASTLGWGPCGPSKPFRGFESLGHFPWNLLSWALSNCSWADRSVWYCLPDIHCFPFEIATDKMPSLSFCNLTPFFCRKAIFSFRLANFFAGYFFLMYLSTAMNWCTLDVKAGFTG